METLKVYDTKGEWFVNKGSYPFVDPTNGCRFEPNVPTQVKKTDWMAMQPCIVPHKPEAEKK